MGIIKITEANAHTVTIPIPTAASCVRKADESTGYSLGLPSSVPRHHPQGLAFRA